MCQGVCLSCESWCGLDMCRLMVETLEREQVDTVIYGMNVIYYATEDLQDGLNEYMRLKHTDKQAINQEIMLPGGVSFCVKIYRRCNLSLSAICIFARETRYHVAQKDGAVTL